MEMFAVVHKDHLSTARVRLMADTKTKAIRLWEGYNPGSKFSDCEKNGWEIASYKVDLIK